jgi:MtN3 and saliva related transmembrane protein
MNSIELLGLAAGTLTTSAFLPQFLKTWREKSAKDLSLTMLLTFSTGVFLWLIYGIHLNSLSIVLANVITLVLTLMNTYLKLRYR